MRCPLGSHLMQHLRVVLSFPHPIYIFVLNLPHCILSFYAHVPPSLIVLLFLVPFVLPLVLIDGRVVSLKSFKGIDVVVAVHIGDAMDDTAY